MQVVENLTDVQLENNQKACSGNGSLSLKSKTLPHMCTVTAGSLLGGIDVPQTSNPFSVEDPNKNQFHHWCWLDVHDVCGICNVFLRGLTAINMRVICNRVFFFEWHIPLIHLFFLWYRRNQYWIPLGATSQTTMRQMGVPFVCGWAQQINFRTNLSNTSGHLLAMDIIAFAPDWMICFLKFYLSLGEKQRYIMCVDWHRLW